MLSKNDKSNHKITISVYNIHSFMVLFIITCNPNLTRSFPRLFIIFVLLVYNYGKKSTFLVGKLPFNNSEVYFFFNLTVYQKKLK